MKFKDLPLEEQEKRGQACQFMKWGRKHWFEYMADVDVDLNDSEELDNNIEDDDNPKGKCEHCAKTIYIDEQYPHVLCRACSALVTDENGHSVAFYNESFGGGLVGYYYDEDEGPLKDQPYNETTVYLNGKQYFVYEHKFGGIVITPDEDNDDWDDWSDED